MKTIISGAVGYDVDGRSLKHINIIVEGDDEAVSNDSPEAIADKFNMVKERIEPKEVKD